MLDYYYFMIQGFEAPFGYVHKNFVGLMEWPKCWEIDEAKRLLSLTGGTDFESRSSLMADTLRRNHEAQKIHSLMHWANEEFPVYSSSGEHVLNFDRCGVDLFGVINYSVHMIGWVMTADGIKIWVPRRAKTKMSFAGKLDNTVGGSLPSDERPIDGIVRECKEEIRLPPEYTRSNIKSCGTKSFQLTITDLLEPACQHQVQYLYEIELTQDIVPTIGDGEVGELLLMSIPEVMAAMYNGDFKLTCNMTYLAFFIRHGYINAENEPNLVEICSRLHRRHALFIA